MYKFQRYNPALPRIITSVRGQKLILGGYRYHIDYVKEGNKKWRCVSYRSIGCKARARTWDDDSKGIPDEGEHNHSAMHELAELDYFKSQLTLAAISDPSADLNTLIDEASNALSKGLNFLNRKTLKKSLVVARRNFAENGEIVLGRKRKCESLPKKSKVERSMNKTSAASPTEFINSSAFKSSTSSRRAAALHVPALSSLLSSSAGSSSGSSGFGSSFGSSSGSGLLNLSKLNNLNWMGAMSDTGFGVQSNEQLLASALFAASLFGGMQLLPKFPSSAEVCELLGLGAAAQVGRFARGNTTTSRCTQSVQQQQRNVTQSSANTPNHNGLEASSSASGTSSATTMGLSQPQRPAALSAVGNAMVPNTCKKTTRMNCILNKLWTKVAEKSASSSPPDSSELAAATASMSSAAVPASKIAVDVIKELTTVATQTDPNMAADNDENNDMRPRKRKLVENTVKQKRTEYQVICCCEDDDELDPIAWDKLPLGCKKRKKEVPLMSTEYR